MILFAYFVLHYFLWFLLNINFSIVWHKDNYMSDVDSFTNKNYANF